MSTPEAQRLAGVLERMPLGEVDQMAADMLRAQAAEIERLTAALDEARAERSVAYLAFEQVAKERDALRADAERWRHVLRIVYFVRRGEYVLRPARPNNTNPDSIGKNWFRRDVDAARAQAQKGGV